MSRGFVKEGDLEEPPFIPPRADLPEGTTNFVTPRGMEKLREEKKKLVEERSIINQENKNESEKRRTAAVISGKLDLLNARIRSARVIDIQDQPNDEVRFGATVTYRFFKNKRKNTITIVGVDEASFKEHRIAFTAPIAKAMIGKKIDETSDFVLGEETKKIKIISIIYS